MHEIAIVVLPGVVAFDLAVPAQVFGHPDEAGRYRVTVCGRRRGVVPTSSGFDVRLAAGLDAVHAADTVIVPGYDPRDEPDPAVSRALRAAERRGARLVSVCTGAFAYAGAGLLDGVHTATHWRDADELAARYPTVRVDADVLYVDDERVWSSAGLAAGIDLCIQVARTDHGEAVAAEIARRMVVAPHRHGTQAQFVRHRLPEGEAGLAETTEWARRHLAQPLTVAVLAERAGWSPRAFARRFADETGMTPHRWLTAQRLLHARELLEATEQTVESVATASGLGTAANLRKLLNRDLGVSPADYRRAFRGDLRARAGA